MECHAEGRNLVFKAVVLGIMVEVASIVVKNE
jgi:hypothetical protein